MTFGDFTKTLRSALSLVFVVSLVVPVAHAQKYNAEQTQAIGLWNQSRRNILDGEYAEAEKHLRQADNLLPHNSRIENMWGLALMKMGKVDEGLEKLLSATADPKCSPTAWINLGLTYEAKGDLNKAIECNKKYLVLDPNGSEAPRIRAYIAALTAGMKTLKSGSADDYFAQATSTYNMHWQKDKMPIKVYILPGDKVPGYRPEFKDIVKASLDDWQNASNNAISYVLIDSPTGADITVKFSDDPTKLSNRAEAGEAKYLGRPPALVRVDVTLLTLHDNHAVRVSDDAFGWLARHELGHALGILGHSPSTSDIMCFLEGQVEKPPVITPRDAKTIQLLYER